MKMKGRKATVFFVLTAIFTGIFTIMAFVAKEGFPVVGNTLLYLIMFNGVLFVGGNTADKLIVSKNFIPELAKDK
jgi:hypothetical protein